MIKVRLMNAEAAGGGGGAPWDGTTPVTLTPERFSLVGGFWEARLPLAAGIVPAALFGRGPGGDPYILHATIFTDHALTSTDIIQIQTIAPVNTRDSFVPAVGNNHATLVRPDDSIAFTLATTARAYMELLIEPLAAENEFGDVLLQYLANRYAEAGPQAQQDVTVSANFVVPPFSGVYRVTSTAGAGISVTAPPASGQRLTDRLLVTRNGAGAVAVTPAGADTFNKAAAAISLSVINTSVSLSGTGTDWTSS